MGQNWVEIGCLILIKFKISSPWGSLAATMADTTTERERMLSAYVSGLNVENTRTKWTFYGLSYL